MADPKVVNAIKRIARQRGVSKKELLAAFETGIVESGLRNLSGGDADSAGWRQERASLYKDPTNITASVNRFFDETGRVKHKYATAGELAAAVQRPAAQYRGRYQQARAEALKHMGGLDTGGGQQRGTLGSYSLPQVDIGTKTTTDEAGYEDAKRKFALGQLIAKRNPQSALLRLGVLPGAPPSPEEFTSTSITSSLQRGSDKVTPSKPGMLLKSDGTPGSAPKPGGGYMGTKAPASALAGIGRELGLKVTSEKRHNTNPHSGKNSDHDHGNKDAYAYDISNGGAPTPEMDRAAYRIMRQLGFKDYKMGQPINTSSGVVEKNGLRFQVIYRGSGAAFGGNHLNHIHIGVKRVGKR